MRPRSASPRSSCTPAATPAPGGETARALAALGSAARHARARGLAVHAGHGLTYQNVQPVAATPEIEELNIGHSIVSNAVFWGLEEAVRRMRQLIDAAATGKMAG